MNYLCNFITSENIQNLATDITMHLLHILEQYICGYLTGVNTNRWQKHVLADTKYELINTTFIASCIYLILPVLLLQKPNKRNLNLTVNMDRSSVVENRLQLHHNARDYDEIIRAYLDTILGKIFAI